MKEDGCPMHELNAKITKTSLGPEDHGIFTAYIWLDYGGSGQGFGGWSFDGPAPKATDYTDYHRVGSVFGMQFIMDLMTTLDVRRWEDLPGTHCRIRQDKPFGLAKQIGHNLKDQWFDPKALADKLHGESHDGD